MKYCIKSLKRHTIIPKVTGYYILKYQVIDDDGLFHAGIATVYYRVDKYAICTEDSNNFKYFGPCDMMYFTRLMCQRYTYFSRLCPIKTTFWENEIEAIKEYVINGTKESHGCIIDDNRELSIINGKYRIPLVYQYLYGEHFTDPAVLNMLKKGISPFFLKDWHNITPVEEDLGESLENNGVFNFTCPICTNEKSPAGFLKMPRPFYEKNKLMIKIILKKKYTAKFLINHSDYKLGDIYRYDIIYNQSFANFVITERVINKLSKWVTYHACVEYTDYYTMFKEMYPNAEPVHFLDIKSERQVSELRWNILNIYEINKVRILLEKYLKIKETFPKYEFSDENFSIFYPETTEDIVTEGSTLHHCVGSYLKRIVEGRNIILFLRKNEELNKSLVTVDIIPTGDSYEIEQAHGKYNCKIDEIPGVSEFVKKWTEKFNIIINNLNKFC